MIIRNEKYREEGLIREAVNCGFGDLRVIVGNEEIRTFKYILYVCNETFRNLLSDPLFEEPLRLCDECSKESFFLLEKYYEGVEIEINEENCVDLLSVCVCYKEEGILKNVVDFIIGNLNGYISVGLLNRRQILENENMKELKEEFEYFVKNENYKIMKNDLLRYLCFDGLKYMFSIGIVFNGKENDLLKLLLDYYGSNLNSIEEKEEMKRLIGKCHFKSEIMNELSEDYKSIINELRLSADENINVGDYYSIRYYSIPDIQNSFLFDFLIFYYPKEDIQTISFKKSNLMSLKDEDISNDINILLNSNNIKIILLTLQLCDSLSMKFDPRNHVNILDFFLDYYKNVDDENKQRILLKRIVEFLSESSSTNTKKIFNKMKEKNGIEFLFVLLKENNLLSRKLSKMLMDYFHEFRLTDEEQKILNSIIEDERTKKMIIYHELKRISYPGKTEHYNGYGSRQNVQKSYNFIIGDEISIIPEINEIIDVEEISIEPNLPSGLSLNSKTGIISGIANEEYITKYDKGLTIRAKNVWNEVSETINITILDKVRFDKTTCYNPIQLDIHEKCISVYGLRYIHDHHFACCLNIKLEKGIYHFIFYMSSPQFKIGGKKYGAKCMEFYWNEKNIIKSNSGKCNNSHYCKTIEVNNKEYEVIYDMYKRTFNIKDNNGVTHLLVSDFEGEICPCVAIDEHGYCSLKKWWIE